MNDVLDKQKRPEVVSEAIVPKKEVKICLPYLGPQSKVLKKCVESLYNQVNVIVVFSNTCR